MTLDDGDAPAAPPDALSTDLGTALHEIEAHVDAGGWDQPARLFALVPTAELVAAEPELAAQLGIDVPAEGAPPGFTPVEQEDLPDASSLDAMLAQIGWPPEVAGAAVVVERLVLPPGAESDLPDDEAEALQVLSEHPDRREMRLAVAVTRDGERVTMLRLRDHPEDLLTGPDLVPALADALTATFED